ncbi:hypothetical protein OROGR_020296 [Orobanche gracilis]
MLSVPYVMLSHCLSIGAFETSKLFAARYGKHGRTVTNDYNNFNFKEKTVYGPFSRPVGRIPYDHHILKALATSDVSAVKISQNVATYRFMTDIGGQLKALVKKKKNNKYGLLIEVESMQLPEGQGDLFMIWGLYRSDSANFMPLDFQLTGTNSSTKSNTIETPFVKHSVGKLSVELEFEEDLAPFYVSILLKFQSGPDFKISTIRSHRKTNFIVPVGFTSGRPYPLGISFSDDGYVNFAFFSRNVESVVLCLYADTGLDKPSLEIDLDPYVNRSGDIWHALIDCSLSFVGYGYRCKSGANSKGNRVLLDPYARVLENFGSNFPRKWLGKLCKEHEFNWNNDIRPSLPIENLVVYRLDVRRFTVDKSSKLPDDIAGTFSGISKKLDHFKNLGVNAILLESIFPFDEQNGPYFPWHFFSPGSLYGPSGNPNTVADSMKEMVKKLHASGIEVLMEVVLTHTSDDGALKEIDNSSYYNINGGLNCNYPVVQQMIIESLRYWAIEFHIDGFCFINASSLTRDVRGEFLSRPPLVEAIAFDPLLSRVKIIADSWDPRGIDTKELAFPHWKRWAEMNAKFCTDVRNFLRGRGHISNLATRLCGSADIFLCGRGPAFSFNFITRNAGPTLVDLVSFGDSGSESECGWNCGEEGPTNKTVVLERRLKQIRNFLFILYISLGVPVLSMGDECGQSSGGSRTHADRKPLDWNALRSGFGIQVMQFLSFLSSLRMRRGDFFHRRSFLEEDNIEWHGVEHFPPNWDDASCKFLALTLRANEKSSQAMSNDLYVAFNSADCSERIVLPRLAADETWVCLVDTSLPFPDFFNMDGVPHESGSGTYDMKSHSCVLFEARSS